MNNEKLNENNEKNENNEGSESGKLGQDGAEKKKKKAPLSRSEKALNIAGIVFCVILIPILIINCVLIIKSFVNKDEVPSIFGFTPLIVNGVSMEPEIKFGDLIFVSDIDAADVRLGDDIAFFDPAGSGTSVVTHRVIEKTYNSATEKITFKTKGINNNTEDTKPVSEDRLVGIYKGARIPFAGKIALFMQTIPGLIVCVLVPLVLLVGYDLLRRKLQDKKKEKDVDALMAELEALRAMQNNNAECEKQSEESEAPAEDVKNAEIDVQNEDAQNERPESEEKSS